MRLRFARSITVRTREGRWSDSKRLSWQGSHSPRLIEAISARFARTGAWIGPLIVAIALLSCGGLWLLRARRMSAGVLAVPAGLILATLGVYSGYTATNVRSLSVRTFAVPGSCPYRAVAALRRAGLAFQSVPSCWAAMRSWSCR